MRVKTKYALRVEEIEKEINKLKEELNAFYPMKNPRQEHIKCTINELKWEVKELLNYKTYED